MPNNKSLKSCLFFLLIHLMSYNLYGQNDGYIIPKSHFDYSTHLINLKKNRILDIYHVKIDSNGIKTCGSIFIDSLFEYLCDSTKFETNDFNFNVYYSGDSNSYMIYGIALQKAIMEIQKKYLYFSNQPEKLYTMIRITFLYVTKNHFNGNPELRIAVSRECEGISTKKGLWEEIDSDRVKKKANKNEKVGWPKW